MLLAGGSPMDASQRVSRVFHWLVCLFVTRMLAGAVLAVMLTSVAAAGPFEDASAAYQRGD